MAIDLAERVASLIEEAWEEDVKEIARAVLPKVAGGDSIIHAEGGFKEALRRVLEVRKQQLADAADVLNDAALR